MKSTAAIERKKNFLIRVAYIAAIGIVLFVFIRYLFEPFLPFILGFLIAFLLKPVISAAAKLMKIKRKPAAVLITFVIYFVFGAVLCIVLSKIIAFAGETLKEIPEIFHEKIMPNIIKVTEWADGSFIGEAIGKGEAAKKIGEIANGLAEKAITFAAKVVADAPGFLLKLVITVIASIFICMDYDRVAWFLARQIPEDIRTRVFSAKNAVLKKASGVARAYFLLMLLTFIQLMILFVLLRIENAVGLAAIISAADMLPLIGAGGILAVWGGIEIIGGNAALGFALIISGIVVAIARNIIEPKLVGGNTGLHPVTALVSMYAGVKLFGFIGLFAAPVAALFLDEINKNGAGLWVTKKAPSDSDGA